MQQSAPRQLSLAVSLNDKCYFSNFYASEPNQMLLLEAKAMAEGERRGHLLLWGAPGVGLTHILQAACHHAVAHGLSHQYLPLAELKKLAPEAVLDGLEQQQLICIDGLDEVAGDARWEQALFHLFNRVRDNGHSTLMSAHSSPQELGISLPDLSSRLLSDLVFRVTELDDENKIVAMSQRAAARGFELSEDVAGYILNHSERSTAALFALLDRLDRESLEQQRKLTIPFVKEVLAL
ncbi:DnaA regulatory inactivator Hda [Agaribacterium haliotis]|uniref:DnaA regulatory inactivator Hda n=1 Tax=Agaribacterium haliotis TaxID=2013869 RepID=UPI000BB58973|nr:DnaA regulatory inactivator Hda [Agaribacterium haliotis]